jgi:hypothetical protein
MSGIADGKVRGPFGRNLLFSLFYLCCFDDTPGCAEFRSAFLLPYFSLEDAPKEVPLGDNEK